MYYSYIRCQSLFFHSHRTVILSILYFISLRTKQSTLPETNIAPENEGWNTTFLLGRPIFRCYVSFREGISFMGFHNLPALPISSIIAGLGSGAFGQVTRCSATFRRKPRCPEHSRVQVALKILKHKDEMFGVGIHCWLVQVLSRLPNSKKTMITELGGGFRYFLFSPLFGEMIQFDYIIFCKWVVQPPTREKTASLKMAAGT